MTMASQDWTHRDLIDSSTVRSPAAPVVDRLSELVEALTGCASSRARFAVQTATAAADPLALVARAMVQVDRPRPEGFRVTGFLREDLSCAPRRRASGRLPRRVIGRLPHRQVLALSA